MTIRISEAGLAKIAAVREALSERAGKPVNRSEVVRRAVVYGLENNPDFQPDAK